MASHLNDLASNVTLQKILQLIPANVFALFTATVTYVTPSGTCDATQRIVVWALFAVVTFVTAYMAIHNRHIPTGTAPPFTTDPRSVALDALRGLTAAAAFAAFTLLQLPTSSCLFPGNTPGSTIVPSYLMYTLLSIIGAATLAMPVAFDDVVTQLHPQPAGDALLPGAHPAP